MEHRRLRPASNLPRKNPGPTVEDSQTKEKNRNAALSVNERTRTTEHKQLGGGMAPVYRQTV